MPHRVTSLNPTFPTARPAFIAFCSRSLGLGLGALAVVAAPAGAQSPDPPVDPKVTPVIQNVTRIEGWSFFEPPEHGGEPDYTLFGNRATLGVRVESARVAVQGSLQYAQLVGLPRQSFGPGPLGPGPVFYVSAENSRAYQLYFKSMSLRLKDVVPRLSIEVGRMAYESGEGTPFAGRLIGNANWTMFERSFDGVRVDYQRPSWRAHASFVMPTQGAFEESASPTIGKVKLTTVSVTRAGLEVFAHHYGDRRAISGRPDNTGASATRADIHVQTVGTSLAYSANAFDVHLWGAAQRGTWYGESHRAVSASADVGYAWARLPWRPALSGGVSHASGDDDPNDRAHGTFFPMVPTTRPDVLAGTYAQMNLQDVHAQLRARPHTWLSLVVSVHRLSLVNRLDRWYSGTGATAFSGTYFGYSSRPSTLARSLGTLTQLSAMAPITHHWRVAATFGMIRGGAVVRRQFAGRSLAVFVLENTVSFP